ncbi:hypothetical protein B0T16DRAFT_405288 [Cercophora newfieldiana]|uniref:DUF6594 domain-containing protein n=1 Tax=Cercophora newfieldiana TaxID=92897 RepID=A0AA40CWT0_9PEZI|nr:hypothetical protein B0T16DRAFT_405288 [Cercophora newfieldiana]
MAGFASDIDAAEKATVRSCTPSRQTTLTPENQHCQCSNMTNEPAAASVDSPGEPPKARINVDDFIHDHCQTRRTYDSAPLGWPRLAAMPHRIYNTDIIRSFNPLGQRLIQYVGARLAFLAQKLNELDREDSGRCDLTEYQKRLPGQPEPAEEYYDMLVKEIAKEYLTYTKLTRRYADINQLHTVPHRRYRQVLKYILHTVGLQNDSLLWVKAPNEALSFTRPPPRLLLWLSSTNFGKWFLKLFATSQRPTCGPASQSGFIRLDAMTMMHRGTITAFALALLIPAGILFLCELTRAQAFAVVVVFTLVFSLQINPQDRHKALYAVCAWCAVLVTIMVQMAGVAPES